MVFVDGGSASQSASTAAQIQAQVVQSTAALMQAFYEAFMRQLRAQQEKDRQQQAEQQQGGSELTDQQLSQAVQDTADLFGEQQMTDDGLAHVVEVGEYTIRTNPYDAVGMPVYTVSNADGVDVLSFQSDPDKPGEFIYFETEGSLTPAQKQQLFDLCGQKQRGELEQSQPGADGQQQDSQPSAHDQLTRGNGRESQPAALPAAHPSSIPMDFSDTTDKACAVSVMGSIVHCERYALVTKDKGATGLVYQTESYTITTVCQQDGTLDYGVATLEQKQVMAFKVNPEQRQITGIQSSLTVAEKGAMMRSLEYQYSSMTVSQRGADHPPQQGVQVVNERLNGMTSLAPAGSRAIVISDRLLTESGNSTFKGQHYQASRTPQGGIEVITLDARPVCRMNANGTVQGMMPGQCNQDLKVFQGMDQQLKAATAQAQLPAAKTPALMLPAKSSAGLER